MSQYDFGTIDPNVKTGTALAADLNNWRDALHSGHAGVARPAYTQPGMLWVKQISGTDWRLMLAAAAGDVEIGAINPTTLANGADTKYLLATARGAANGVAPLDVTSKIPVTNLSQSFGQCRFEFVSGTECRLWPFDGDLLSINGTPRQIPLAGIPIANTALPLITTIYYIYAWWTGSAIALEASTTGHVNGTGGIRTKNGDATRTLVGMARKGGGGTFASDVTARYTLSWFNRKRLGLFGNAPGGIMTAVTPVPMAPQVAFINWGVDPVVVACAYNAWNSGGANWFAVGMQADSSTIIPAHIAQVVGAGGGSGYVQIGHYTEFSAGGFGEAVHTLNTLGHVDGGSVTVVANSYICGTVLG